MKLFVLSIIFVAVLSDVFCENSFIDSVKSVFNVDKFKSRNKKCMNKKKAGKIPNQLDSPLPAFGFEKSFDTDKKVVEVNPGLSLTVVKTLHREVRVPINVGAKDFVISGYANELVAFFECFGDYDVIGSELTANGKWPLETGEIKLQLQNVNPLSASIKGDVFKVLFDIAVGNILKVLDPSGVATELYNLEEALRPMLQYVPSPKPFKKKVKEIYKLKIPLKEKKDMLLEWLNTKYETAQAEWKGNSNVDISKKFLMELTMYTKPENQIRAIFNTKLSKISMKDIANELKSFFYKS